jgi:ABC-type multidrug transport system ATPase subunit
MNVAYQNAEALIIANDVSVAIDGKVIIRNIGNATFPFCITNTIRENINQGQIIAVLGRSGRGKSTFFKALVGILAPAKGDIKILQHGTTDKYAVVKEGDIGFVQQMYPLSRNQTILQMFVDAAKQGGLSATTAKELIDNYLQEWGLMDQKNLSPNQLSGGQKQRVAIIEQLLCAHQFMIFDEPFSGLDVCNIAEVKESFDKINTSNDKNTILFSTHDIEIAVELADHIYIMGFEKNSANEYLPGGTIVGSYDLKAMGLAWKTYSAEHTQLVDMIKKQMENS